MIFGQAAREIDQIHRAFGDDDVVALEHFKIENMAQGPSLSWRSRSRTPLLFAHR